MRRYISFLLSLVMLFSVLTGNTVYAATSANFKLSYLSKIGIKETKEGLVESEISKDAEEATFEWSILNEGYYELVYYSEQIADNPGGTSKITLGFEVGKDKDGNEKPNTIRVTGKISKFNTVTNQYEAINLTNYQYEFPYTGKYQQSIGTEFISELSYRSDAGIVAQSLKEISLRLGKNLNIRAFVEGNQLKVWTNGINKGYITDFILNYSSKQGSTVAYSDTVVVFPGISNTEISSTHLVKSSQVTTFGGLQSVKTIYAPGETAGSEPGIKFEFERPKIRVNNQFTYIDGTNGGSDLKTTINLDTKLEPDDTLGSNQIQVNFNLEGTSSVSGNIIPSGVSKKVRLEKMNESDVDSHKIALYFSKDDNFDDNENIIAWPALEESMVIGGAITISGTVTVEGKTYTISTGNVALNTGYTYLKYVPEQTNIGETTLLVTPYKYKGDITYQVYYVNGDNIIDENKTLFGSYKFRYDPAYPNRKLEISIPSNEVSKFMIKAILSYESDNAKSQEVVYNPKSSDITINPYTPQIREVNNIYVIPEAKEPDYTDLTSGVEAAGFDIIWNAPTEEKLKDTITEQGRLYFELALLNSDKGNKAVIAVFEASLQGENVVVKQLGNSQGTVTYDKANNQFIATKVMLKEMEKSAWEKVKLDAGYETGTSYPDIAYEGGLSYKIPNSFYLTMRAVLDPNIDPSSTAQLKLSTNESTIYPLTLDSTMEVVPAPTIISNSTIASSTDTVLKVNNVSIKRFIDYILAPAKWNLLNSNQNITFPGKYEIVLYQDTYLDNNTNRKNDISDNKLEEYIEISDEKIFTVSQTLTVTSNVLDVTSDNEEIVKALRKGKIIKFNYDINHLNGDGDIEVKFKGLDPNQSYYVRVRTVVESERIKNNETQKRVDKSLFSKLYGFTTTTESKPINPDEEIPPTPKNFIALAKDNSTAILNWQDPDMKIADGNTLSYEIIRTTSQKINENLLSKRNLKASDIINSEVGKKAVLLTDYKLVSIDGEISYELTDDILQPNTMYYYYIRTVYKGLYSDWIYQPVTTLNIEKPISLKGYNATKTTVDISFLAKVPYDAVPSTFDFGIAIQGEDETAWTTVSYGNLTRLNSSSAATAEDGYYYYEYRISGLKPGKRYNIKVCVIDKSKEMIDGKYQQSLYSESIYIRTEYDEEEQIKDDKFQDYLDKFDQEIEKLKKKAYWVVKEGSVYKYRAEYLNSDMSLKKQYQLVSAEGSANVSYYLPASIINQMNSLGVMLEIVLGDQTVSIRPQTILDTTSEVKEAIELKANRELSDYYVVISVNKSSYTATINGEDCISPKIEVEMDIAYMRQEDILTEANILEALSDIIQDERKDFITQLEKKIDKGVIADDLLQEIIDEFIADIEEEHTKQINKIMTRQERKVISILAIEKSILITHKSESALVNGYYYANGWVQVSTYSSGESTYLEANRLGVYIFTGQKELIETVPSLAPYQNFINQYRLDEFFTLDSYMIKTAVSKQQLYGALARVIGAPANSDYVNYLTSKGIKGVSKLGLKNDVRQDETVYLIMQGYEVSHHRDIDSVVIKNKQSVTNIGAFQPIYRSYVYAAIELKVVDNPNAKVIPSKQMTSEEIIKMLYKIQA